MSLSTRFEQHTAHATRSLGKVLTLVPHDPATIVAIPQRPAYRQLVVDAGSAARGNVLALHAACLFVQDSLVLLLLPCDPRHLQQTRRQMQTMSCPLLSLCPLAFGERICLLWCALQSSEV